MSNAQDDLYEALCAISEALRVPRNRFGKLLTNSVSSNHIKELAIKYKVGGCEDIPDQCQKVAEAVIRKYIRGE